MENRKNENFINSKMEGIINAYKKEENSVKNEFDTNSQIFLDLCIKYIHMLSMNKINQIHLPPINKFYSSLTGEHMTE